MILGTQQFAWINMELGKSKLYVLIQWSRSCLCPCTATISVGASDLHYDFRYEHLTLTLFPPF
jgi:hypothetical protein